MRSTVLRHRPRIRKAGCVPIADNRLLIAFGSSPAASLWSSIREMPGEKETVLGFLPSSDLTLEANRAYRAGLLRIRTQLAIARKIVPKGQRAVPPGAAGPSAQTGDVAV